jgi:hypothetical protein
MSSRQLQDDSQTCCAFCRKAFSAVNGQTKLWRAPTGLLFCSEFCADDAEEAIFQSRGRPNFNGH